jgi:hypothetical protein
VTPPMLSPERLAELLDDAVRHVTARGDALDRIRRGVRRRRAARRAGAVLLTVAVLAGSGSTALALTSASGPSRLASSAAAGKQPSTGPTPAATAAYQAVPPKRALAAGPSGDYAASSAAKAAIPSAAKAAIPSSGQVASWDIDGDGQLRRSEFGPRRVLAGPVK